MTDKSDDKILTKAEKLAKIRKSRAMVQAGPLGVDRTELDPTKRYFIATDENLHRAKQSGWEPASRDIHIGDSGLISGSQGMGQVNLKGGLHGTLLEMDMEIFDALEQDKDELNKAREDAAIGKAIGRVDPDSLKDKF